MNRDADSILPTILENPDDDTPRLIYADAIENDHPARAEFIRVQIALSKRKVTEANHRHSDRLMGRYQSKKYSKFDPESTAGLLREAWGEQLAEFRMERGFPTYWEGKIHDWLDRGPKIVMEFPIRPHVAMIRNRHPDDCGESMEIIRFVYFEEGDIPPNDNSVPSEVYKYLRTIMVRMSSTNEAARIALAEACIAWARNKPLTS